MNYLNTRKCIIVTLVLSVALTINPMIIFARLSTKVIFYPQYSVVINDPAFKDFGSDVVIDGNTLVVIDNYKKYSQNNDPLYPLWIYVKSNKGNWGIQQKLYIETSFTEFDISGDTLIAYSLYATEARVFTRQSGVWNQTQTVSPLFALANELVGDIAIDGDRLLIGTTHFTGSNGYLGCVYIYEKSSEGIWEFTDIISVPTKVRALAIDGDRIAISAIFWPGWSAKVFVYKHDQIDWVKQTEIEYSDHNIMSIDISGTTLVTGIKLLNGFIGRIDVYEEYPNGQTWSLKNTFYASPFAPPETYFTFGDDVAIDGDLIVTADDETNLGHVYGKSGGTWTQWKSASGEPFPYCVVALSGNIFAIGNPIADEVYIYDTNTLAPDYPLWAEHVKIHAQNIFTAEFVSMDQLAVTQMSMGTSSQQTYPIRLAGPSLATDYRFYELSKPVRLLDTRSAEGACYLPGAPLQGQNIFTQQAIGRCGEANIPLDAVAIIGRVKVMSYESQTTNNRLTFFTPGTDIPRDLFSNYAERPLASDLVVVGLSRDGKFAIYPENSTHLSIEVIGYFVR